AGVRILAGDHAETLAAAILWWIVLEAAALSVFGTVLRAKTHHHGLAGVTFAVLALISGLVVALLAVRAHRMLRRMPLLGQRAGLWIAAAALFLVVMLIGVRTARATGIHTAGGLVDALALAVTGALASARPFGRLRPLAIVGVPVAIIIVAAGFSTL